MLGERRVCAGCRTNPGRDMVLSKCFQCHADSMFRDQRQERRAWEAAIYRMIGRGALLTPEEIKLMADYLGTDFGPNAKPAAASEMTAAAVRNANCNY